MPNVVGQKTNRVLGDEFQTTRGYIRSQSWLAPTDEVVTSDDVLKSTASAVLMGVTSRVFTISSGSATAGAVYSNNGHNFTVVTTVASGTQLVTTQDGAPGASGTLTKVSGTGGSTLTFSASSAIVQPDFARVLSVISTLSDHDAAGVVTINGLDIRGNVISDAITLNGSTVVNGVKAFASVTSIDLTAVTAIDATAGVAVGRADLLGLDRTMIGDDLLHGTVGGTHEATRPTVTYSATDISLNTVAFNTDLDGSSLFAVLYVTRELQAKY